MRLNKTTLSIVAGATFALAASGARATGPDDAGSSDAVRLYAASDTAPAEPDNSGRNVRDDDGSTLTPTDQSNAPADVALTQKIRKGITSNDAMSVQARNIKIITRSGVVTLRGPVKTMDERTTIESLAKSAGATRIDNQLEIDRDAKSGEEE